MLLAVTIMAHYDSLGRFLRKLIPLNKLIEWLTSALGSAEWFIAVAPV